jgi:hypothetical protein
VPRRPWGSSSSLLIVIGCGRIDGSGAAPWGCGCGLPGAFGFELNGGVSGVWRCRSVFVVVGFARAGSRAGR